MILNNHTKNLWVRLKDMKDFDITNPFIASLFLRQIDKTYDGFINAIHHSLLECFEHLEENSNMYINDSEDKISHSIITFLKGRCWDCTSETNSNGHVDITIKLHQFKWLAEAKIHKGIDWTTHGFNQLTQNYSIARSNSNHGGLIIYNKNKQKNSKQLALEWSNYLTNHDSLKIKCKQFTENCYFDSTIEEHPRSGNPYHLRNYFVNLMYTKSEDF